MDFNFLEFQYKLTYMENPPLTAHSCFWLKVYSEVILFKNPGTDTKIRHVIHLGQHPAPKPPLPHALHFLSDTICVSMLMQPSCHHKSTPWTTVFSGAWGALWYTIPTSQVVAPTLITSHRGEGDSRGVWGGWEYGLLILKLAAWRVDIFGLNDFLQQEAQQLLRSVARLWSLMTPDVPSPKKA